MPRSPRLLQPSSRSVISISSVNKASIRVRQDRHARPARRAAHAPAARACAERHGLHHIGAAPHAAVDKYLEFVTHASATAGRISSGAHALSSCRPPWLDRTMPSTPCATAASRRPPPGCPDDDRAAPVAPQPGHVDQLSVRSICRLSAAAWRPRWAPRPASARYCAIAGRRGAICKLQRGCARDPTAAPGSRAAAT